MKMPLSPRAQRLILALAPDEAYKLGSKELEVEHVILGLLKSADGLGYISLQQLRINVLTMQLEIEQIMPHFEQNALFVNVPFSKRLNEFLENTEVTARSLGQEYVGTEHILLTAVAEPLSLVSKYFKKAGISYEQVKRIVIDVQRKVPSSYMIASDSAEENYRPVPLMSDGTRQKKSSRQQGLLAQFSRDLTEEAKEGLLDPVIGRSEEVLRIIQILCRRTKNNPVLIGEPGVGKTAIVEGLAQKISDGDVPVDLLGKRVLNLDIAAMVAGTKYRGEFEERLKRVMKEIKEEKNIILFVDELHTIIGAGGPEGALDASNMLKPALSRGQIQIIGATTTKEFRKYIEKDAAFARRFQQVTVDEPTEEETRIILEGLKPKYEQYHRVVYDDGVIPLIAKYSKRYISEKYLPDKAIDVLDEAGSAKKIQEGVRPEEIEKTEELIEKLSEEKRELVSRQDYEKAAFVRDKVNALRLELDSLNLQWKKSGAAGVLRVTTADVCKTISRMTGIALEELDVDETLRLVNMEKSLHTTVVGQEEAINLISSAVRRNRSGVSSAKRPVGSFIFLGPTGVGKTQLAKSLAKFLFGTEEALIRVDMSDYMEKQNASRLVGAPPGYVGYEEGGMLTEQIRQHPYSVVLLDEIEKAHHDIFNLLLQLLEEGELKDNLGHTVSFRNTVIIMTSNAGARQIKSESRIGFSENKEGLLPYEEIKSSAMEELKRIMTPELLNRIDDVVVFKSLEKAEIAQILEIQLGELQERLAEQNISIELKNKAKEYLVENGYDPSMGARPMRRLIQREIEDPLSILLLSGIRGESSTVVVDYDGQKISVKFKKARKNALVQKTPVLVEQQV